MEHQTKRRNMSLVQRFYSNPRVQQTISKAKYVAGNALQKYEHGLDVSKKNARDTLNEMGKFFSASEAKSSYFYAKDLAKETHEELVGRRVRLLSDAAKTVFEAQAFSLFNRDTFSIDHSAEDDTEEQD